MLIEAIGEFASATTASFTLDIVGNLSLSDQLFAESVAHRVRELRLGDRVVFATGVDDDALWARLERTHVLICPSLHEGLCVPVIEAYGAGCRVVASDGGNLRYLVRPPDPVVPAGDATALAAAIAAVVDEVSSAVHVDRGAAREVRDLYSVESTRSYLHAALDELIDPVRATVRPWPSAARARL